jgi:hypothetical protein
LVTVVAGGAVEVGGGVDLGKELGFGAFVLAIGGDVIGEGAVAGFAGDVGVAAFGAGLEL